MAENVVRVRASRAEIRRLMHELPRVAMTGGTVQRGLMDRIGIQALSFIREAFLAKARGGSDEAGESWKPLKKSTIAYKRRHPGLPGPKVRARYAPSYALTREGRKQWWSDYSRRLAMYKGDQAHAAAVAWLIAKQAGEVTLMELYGDTPVEILRDTGLLLNTLSPGRRSPDRIFRTGPGEVEVGTNRKYAGVHHRGNRRVPQRRLWPEPRRWPAAWWNLLTEALRGGLVDVAIWLLRSRK